MAKIYVNDAGTWRQPSSIFVNDAGTWRNIKTIYVNDAGTWRTVFNKAFASMSGTLTAATFFVTSNGYSNGNGGSMSPITFSTGQTVTDWYDTSGTTTSLAISGFSSDPTQNGFFTTATYNGTSKTAASATGYSYSAGKAIWTWNGSLFGFGSNVGVSKAYSIT